ncbi:MAG TPA: phospholipid carrier-dependent glycosyltransferase [Vicinamibacterales bacterium]|nr:phospholipid carrier-dependent glycosyltransferase [Vicinamibacterales bacterium]
MTRRDLIGLWLLACLASAAVGTHGIVYWDAGDYVTLAITGGRSGLFLGRPLFLLISHAVVNGIDPAWAEPVLRWFWTIAGALAAPAMAVLATRLGLKRNGAWLAGAMVAVSPSFVHTAHQVLTDAPALAMSMAALAAAAGGQAIATGALLGAAILTRETAAIHIVAAVLLLGFRRSAVAGLSLAAIAAVTLWAMPPPGVGRWYAALSHNAAANPITAGSIGVAILWVLAAGPLPVVTGLLMWGRTCFPQASEAEAGKSAENRYVPTAISRRVLLVAAPAAVATCALLFYPEGSFSPRYVLAAVPIAFFLPAATWLTARRWPTVIGLAIPLAIVPIATQASRAAAARGTIIEHQIRLLPRGALVVAGHYCPQARVGAAISKRDDLALLCPGWDWPDDPGAILDAAIAEGRPVAIDVTTTDWWKHETANFVAVQAWAAGHTGRNLSGFLIIDP